MYRPWVEATFGFAKFTFSIARIGREWGLEGLMKALTPPEVKRRRDNHVRFAAEKTERPDIWTYVTKHSNSENALKLTELHSNGAAFMLAGTETSATELAGLTYTLLKNPAMLHRLVKDIRGAFTTLEDITMTKLSQLEYLQACIEEGLRIYPPVPGGLPRVVPKGGANVCGHWIPGGVSCGASKTT
jgi:cytochrome P450